MSEEDSPQIPVARWAPLALMAMPAATPNSILVSVISEALLEWHYLAHFQPVFDWHSSRFLWPELGLAGARIHRPANEEKVQWISASLGDQRLKRVQSRQCQ